MRVTRAGQRRGRRAGAHGRSESSSRKPIGLPIAPSRALSLLRAARGRASRAPRSVSRCAEESRLRRRPPFSAYCVSCAPVNPFVSSAQSSSASLFVFRLRHAGALWCARVVSCATATAAAGDLACRSECVIAGARPGDPLWRRVLGFHLACLRLRRRRRRRHRPGASGKNCFPASAAEGVL